MPGPHEVHVRGRKVIACTTREEAEDWAALLGTSNAPANVLTKSPKATGSPEADPRQQSIFDSLEGTA